MLFALGGRFLFSTASLDEGIGLSLSRKMGQDDLMRGAPKILIVALGLTLLYAISNLLEPYQAVDARITKVEQVCDFYRPKNKKGWPEVRNHKPVPPGSVPCDAAKERELNRTSEFPVKRYYVLFVDYVSPSDGQRHSQRIQIAVERLPVYLADLNPGMTIKLSASKTEPYSVRSE